MRCNVEKGTAACQESLFEIAALIEINKFDTSQVF